LGLDAGGLDDFTSLAVVGETEDGQTLLWVHSWLHESGYEKRAASTPLAEFKAAGDLTVFPNVNGDLDAVEAVVDRIKDHVVCCGVDPHGLRELVRRMEAKGVPVVGISQGWKLSPFIHQTIRDIHSGTLRQYGGPLTRWCISNARIREHGQAIALEKPNGSSVSALKIDAAIAMVMALAVKAEHAPAREPEFQMFFV
jgi:phage terminase large subunit-like protein